MLKQDKVRKTPEDIKKAKAIRMKNETKEMTKHLLVSTYSRTLNKMLESGMTEAKAESIRAEWRQHVDIATRFAAMAVEQTDATWKAIKGKYISDD